MNILVCIKQVPGSSNINIDPQTGNLIRSGVDSKLNPYDLYALEAALQLAEQKSGRVFVLTMGPPQAQAVVAEAVYMGAERGFVVSDQCFAGADVLATSYTLSQAVKSLDRFDLIVCGKQTTDGDTAQVGAELAEFLQLPYAGNVLAVEESTDTHITVRINLDYNIIRQRLPLPCLISTESDINTPRLPSYKRKKQYSDLPILFMSLQDFEDKNPGNYGMDGSPTQVERIFSPEKNSKKKMLSGEDGQLSEQLFSLLEEMKFI